MKPKEAVETIDFVLTNCIRMAKKIHKTKYVEHVPELFVRTMDLIEQKVPQQIGFVPGTVVPLERDD